jgi:hypothetical protein
MQHHTVVIDDDDSDGDEELSLTQAVQKRKAAAVHKRKAAAVQKRKAAGEARAAQSKRRVKQSPPSWVGVLTILASWVGVLLMLMVWRADDAGLSFGHSYRSTITFRRHIA